MSHIKEIIIPDLGGAADVDVIEVLVSVGDEINKEDPLITLEGDKATMEVPSPYTGKIEQLKIKVGDKASEGTVIGSLVLAEEGKAAAEPTEAKVEPEAQPEQSPAPEPVSKPEPKPELESEEDMHAGPGVRRMARELGVNLSDVSPTGVKLRILKEDVQRYVKMRLSQPSGAAQWGPAPAPVVDFSKFGETETQPLNKIKRLTGINVHRSWVTVPHVTQFDEADITALEAFRQERKAEVGKQGVKLTPLAFVMKAVVAALKAFPTFNASLDPSGEKLILKKYFHLGVAVDTPNGLVVPVIRNVDQKGVVELAKELGEISKKAREKGLSVAEMSGSCLTISSLGGIGGTAFTPVVNAPDVAILGLSKSMMKPVYQEGEWVPRLMLPLSLSYDHRVIDGAEGARFMVYLSNCLADIRTLLL